MVKEVITGH
jgi:hypothetical protein